MRISNINNFTRYNSNILFKGSFKVRLDDYIPDEPVKTVKKEPIKKIEGPQKVISRSFENKDANGQITTTKMWSMSEENFKSKAPKSIETLVSSQNIKPNDDIFIISDFDKQGRRIILFNSFFYDRETKKDSIQLFFMRSNDDKLTELQKDAIRIFNDTDNKNYLKKGSKHNPLAQLSDYGDVSSKIFSAFVKGWALSSNGLDISDISDEKGNPYPIIYTADGSHTRYKVFKIDI